MDSNVGKSKSSLRDDSKNSLEFYNWIKIVIEKLYQALFLQFATQGGQRILDLIHLLDRILFLYKIISKKKRLGLLGLKLFNFVYNLNFVFLTYPSALGSQIGIAPRNRVPTGSLSERCSFESFVFAILNGSNWNKNRTKFKWIVKFDRNNSKI